MRKVNHLNIDLGKHIVISLSDNSSRNNNNILFLSKIDLIVGHNE